MIPNSFIKKKPEIIHKKYNEEFTVKRTIQLILVQNSRKDRSKLSSVIKTNWVSSLVSIMDFQASITGYKETNINQ